jgi:hypothetical protein
MCDSFAQIGAPSMNAPILRCLRRDAMTNSNVHESAPDVVALGDAELEALIVQVGFELAEHEVYLDLANPGHGPFRALSGQTAGSGNRYIAESSVESAIWHTLVRRDAAAAVTHDQTADPPATL